MFMGPRPRPFQPAGTVLPIAGSAMARIIQEALPEPHASTVPAVTAPASWRPIHPNRGCPDSAGAPTHLPIRPTPPPAPSATPAAPIHPANHPSPRPQVRLRAASTTPSVTARKGMPLQAGPLPASTARPPRRRKAVSTSIVNSVR